jgi:hypothetical protein
MLDRIINVFTSLRLTVVCLAMALVLVFAGTLAQVDLGLYQTQERYFHSLFVTWSPEGASWKIPVWPGGYLLGTLLLINLIAAHLKRFKFTKGKVGIFMIHAGLILLLVGQFFTEAFQVETFMRLEEGHAKNFTESGRKHELALVDVTDPNHDKVIVIPETFLVNQAEISHPELPFILRVKEFLPNSIPELRGEPASQIQGVGQKLQFENRPVTHALDDENKPAAIIEILAGQQSVGQWSVSTWLTKFPWVGEVRRVFGRKLGSLLSQPQTFTHEGRTWQVALRPVRYYKPFTIQLLDFTHDRYKGTEIPKNFSSRIRLVDPRNNENREVLIYMNNPLRYNGETYYQGGFEPGDTVSILQVVSNPSWLAPYISVTLVGLGLTIQFLSHLIAFAKRRSS